jgi:hypothetical protein
VSSFRSSAAARRSTSSLGDKVDTIAAIDVDTPLRSATMDDSVPCAAGFSDSEVDRLSACLTRLMPHLRRDDVAITGGVAIQLGMAEFGRAGSRKVIADLDLVASSIDAVLSSVAGAFLVSHYHVVQPGVPKFMVQLVDPVSRIRVDVFPDLVGSLMRARVVKAGAQLVRMLALKNILEHKLLTISKASPGSPVDMKHAHDAYALGKLFGCSIPTVADGSLVEEVYGIDEDFCRRCELSSSPRFPLAPKDQIFSLLGGRGTTSVPTVAYVCPNANSELE